MWIYKSKLSPDAFLASGDKFNRQYLDEVYRGYRVNRSKEIPKLSETEFREYEKSGKRVSYERAYFARRTMLRDFAINAWLGNDEAVVLYEKTASAICEEISWALPAHIGGEEPYTVIDLFASETAQTLTETASLLKDRISEKTLYLILGEVKKRVTKPFLNRERKYNWETMKSNWCAVCGGTVGITLIYLTESITELKKQTACLEDVFESYMESFTDDGACLEGLYYWGYGMMYLTAFLELYRERTGESFPVNEHKLRKMADFAYNCCISGGVTVSFSDGNEHDRIYSGLLSKLSEIYGARNVSEEYIARFDGDDCGRWCKAVRDIAWTRSVKYTSSEKCSVMPNAQWAVIRSGELSFAIKGGNNGEPHNHNDIGSFIVVKGGKAILCDLGAGEYTRDYFSHERYNILCNRSMGHSVPIIDGREQKSGKQYHANDFVTEGSKASMEISGAYSAENLEKCVREIELANGRLILTDTFKTTEKACITERLITRFDAALKENGADIISDGKCIASIVISDNTDMEISHHIHYEHNGEETKITAVDFKFYAKGKKKFRMELQ